MQRKCPAKIFAILVLRILILVEYYRLVNHSIALYLALVIAAIFYRIMPKFEALIGYSS